MDDQYWMPKTRVEIRVATGDDELVVIVPFPGEPYEGLAAIDRALLLAVDQTRTELKREGLL